MEKIRQIYPNRMPLAETARNLWVMTCEEGTTREDINNTNYWNHVAKMLRPGDKIEVRTDESAFYAEFYVVSCGKNWAKVKELCFHDLAKVPITDSTGGFEVKWKGPHRKWAVLRISDGEVVSEKHEDQETAEQAKVNLIKSL